MVQLSDAYYFLIGISLALGFLSVLWPLAGPHLNLRTTSRTQTPGAVSMRFEDGRLVEASNSARRLVGDTTELAGVSALLAERFPEFNPSDPAHASAEYFASGISGDNARLEVSRAGQSLSLVLRETPFLFDDLTKQPIAPQETTRLRDIIDHSPLAIWTTNASGTLIDKNLAFDALELDEGVVPFADGPESDHLAQDTATRLPLVRREKKEWFDITRHEMADGITCHFAQNADTIVSAEAAQRNFVQTLAKTFAQLSIGLAIFDRNRQLALFNPALIDLTSLPAESLSARPTMHNFFDQLRDRQIMPEPRNYNSWRSQLDDILQAAETGHYCETWTLPTGLTYRINGKPHPDGAVAFLFEDISAEISLTRRFRAELELSQSALDVMDSAIGVFSRSGTLTFSNARFRDIWKCDPDESFIEMGLRDFIEIWKEASAPTDTWTRIGQFVTATEDRNEWHASIDHLDRGKLNVKVSSLSGGATIVQFSQAPARADATTS